MGGRKNHQLAGWMAEAKMNKPMLAEAIERASAQATGRVITVSLRTIERWINDGARPREPLPTLVAAVVGSAAGIPVSVAELGWPAAGNQTYDTDVRAGRLGSSAEAVEEQPPVLRRELLRILLAGGGVTITTDARRMLDQARSLMDTTLAGSTSTTGAIGAWEERAWAFGSGYHGRPPVELLREVVAEFLEVQSVLDRPLTGSQRKRLADVAGRLAGVAAVILHDVGEHRPAMEWFATGTNAAAQAGDSILGGWLLARSAMIAVNYGSPAAAVDQTRKAQATLGRAGGAPATLAAAVQARGFALMGRTEAAHASMHLADESFEHLTDEDRADTWWGYEEQKHLVHASHALTVIGESGKARQAQTRALELTKPSSHLTRALLQLDGAACLVKDGEVEAGAKAALGVLTGLAAGYSSGLIAARAAAVDHAIPAAARSRPDVLEFRSVLPARSTT